jgi:3-oxoacyl-[acyl-carrier protein] reductase
VTRTRKAAAAIVTGGTGAIGFAVCRLLADAGQRVAFTYQSNDEARDEVLDYLNAVGFPSLSRAMDLTDVAATRAFVSEVTGEIGPVHTLVHAAGPLVPQRFVSEIDAGEFGYHLRNETQAFFNVVQACLPSLRESGGSVTAVTTVATRRFLRRDALSSAPKAGIEALVRALASEEGKFGVRANCVGPGILGDGMASELHANGDFDGEARDRALRSIPLGRFGSALEVAQLVCFLASDKADYISGQMVDVDGGYGL